MSAVADGRQRRLFVPEVVQTSAMDCGPAVLKSLLGGFGIHVSYGRLREACQTAVDGTSIDAVEEVAVQLGLEAEQVVVPADHVLLAGSRCLPGVVVVRNPDGLTHFIVAWRRLGPRIQVMDPVAGRGWRTPGDLLAQLYLHVLPVPARAWRDWAASEEFLDALRRRLARIGIGPPAFERLIAQALSDASWRGLAILDAALRMVDSIVQSRGLARGREAAAGLEALIETVSASPQAATRLVPAEYWCVTPSPPQPHEEEQLLYRGAVVVRVRGRRPVSEGRTTSAATGEDREVSPELMAALCEPPTRPMRHLLAVLRADGALAPLALAAAMALGAAAVVAEALLFRAFFDVSPVLGLAGERVGALAGLLLFVIALWLLDVITAAGVRRMGRHLEVRVRMSVQRKIASVDDRYFRSRLTADMAARAHAVHALRLFPWLSGHLIRSVTEILVTVGAITWLDPPSGAVAALAALAALGLPLATLPTLVERDLRERTHAAALGRFYLDALLGLIAIRAHAAERAVRRQHERLLVEWARTSLGTQRRVVAVEAVEGLVGLALAAALVLSYAARHDEMAGGLLLAYWALTLPGLGQHLALLVRQYAAQHNTTARLLEPLGAPTEEPAAADAPAARSPAGVSIIFEGVGVRVGGRMVLEGIDVAIEPGTHVAIIGWSGAGKSTLLGLLLGWHRPASGRLLVDGEGLDGASLERLRGETAWVDPSVQLWNSSLLANLQYGLPPGRTLALDRIVRKTGLRRLLARLPGGFQCRLGEAGALTSGGEGQRVRFGRAFARTGTRLAVLDEPFRGLDPVSRRRLLRRARRRWRRATMLCVTHDVSETRSFERVLVVENGRIVEDGVPDTLAAEPGSRYRALLEAERAVRRDLGSPDLWRVLKLEDRRLIESGRPR